MTDVAQKILPSKLQIAKRRVAIQEGGEAHKRFAKRLSIPESSLHKAVGPRYVYVSSNFNVCLSGEVDILHENYLFEVKNSLASPSKRKKLGKPQIRECQFYMMLCEVNWAFFVVEHSKEIFVVPYDEGIFQETKVCAKELAEAFMDRLAGQQ